jgi:hypothetical protein
MPKLRRLARDYRIEGATLVSDLINDVNLVFNAQCLIV